ncbi:MAG: hypothetical protein ABJA80_14900 [bacterium]
MIQLPPTRTASFALAALALAACVEAQSPNAAKRSLPHESAVVGTSVPPDSQFARFLSLAIATRAPRVGKFSDVYECRDSEALKDVRWLADYRILSVHTTGDSAVATAQVTTVARQHDGATGWVADAGIRVDTARWRMRNVAAGATKRWKVCGDAMEHFGVFMLGRTVRWAPAGSSAATAKAAVDSIRRARGLALAR